MGILRSLTDTLGFTAPDAKTTQVDFGHQLYDNAAAGVKDVGSDPNGKALRSGVEQAALNQLGLLQNNAAGKKRAFLEDMSRGYGADTQQRARAAGGTGTMAGVMGNSAGIDAEARARSRGLVDLQDQAIGQIGQIQGLQGNFYNQDFQKQGMLANMAQSELAARRGLQTGNMSNERQAASAQRGALTNTMQGAASVAGGKFAKFGSGFGEK